MKYNDFKIFKFSTITKKINRTIENFSRNLRIIKRIPYKIINFFDTSLNSIFLATTRIIRTIVNNFLRIFNIINLKKLDYKKFYKFLDIRSYNFYKINKKINFSNFKFIPIYIFASIIIVTFFYAVIPVFYNYDKLSLQKNICKNYNIKCLIKGEISYSFYPSPRIKVKDFIINDLSNKK